MEENEMQERTKMADCGFQVWWWSKWNVKGADLLELEKGIKVPEVPNYLGNYK